VVVFGDPVERGLADAVREFLKSERAGYRPTPLLFWFLAHAGDDNDASEQISINAEDFGFIYESVLADAASGGDTGLAKGGYPNITLSSEDLGRPIFGEIRCRMAPKQMINRRVGKSAWLSKCRHPACGFGVTY
jgi:hypothetical protein